VADQVGTFRLMPHALQPPFNNDKRKAESRYQNTKNNE